MGARLDLRSHQRAALFAILASAGATALVACSSESNPRPPDTTFTTSSGTTTSATGTGGAGGGGGSTGSSSATGTGGAGGAPSCDGPNGCYSCAPKTGTQLLNACTTSQCSPFDNAARLPLYNNGNLPPLP